MKLIYIFPLVYILFSCSTIKICEKSLEWSNGFKQSSSELIVKNDSILLGCRGGDNYLLDSYTGKIKSTVSKEFIEPYLRKFGDKVYDDSKGNRYFTNIMVGDRYEVSCIHYGRIFRWQTYDKTKIKVLDKKYNKTLIYKFKIAEFSSVFQIIPYGTNKLVISYDTYDRTINKVGMINLDEIFNKRKQ